MVVINNDSDSNNSLPLKCNRMIICVCMSVNYTFRYNKN